MVQVLFFDADKDLKTFLKKHNYCGIEPVFFYESLNYVPTQKLRPYLNASIISIFTHSKMVDNAKLTLFKNLKLIATRSTGINHLDLDFCKRHNIQVANVPYYGAQTVAEFAFGLLLALSRKIILAQSDMSRNRVRIQDYIGFDLAGKTIGIIGTGSIGSHMIQLAKGFDMKVLAYDPFPKTEFSPLYTSLNQLYAKSDIISLHIPSSDKNKHLLNQAAFVRMKKGVYIINTARGDLIDTQALYQAVQQGIVAGAGLDVLENEDFLLHDDIDPQGYAQDTPFLLDSALNLKLLQNPNIIATPHIAFNTSDALARIIQTTLDNIYNFLNNKPSHLVT
ncbi:MAG: hydroxyacid dehydrogenase [Alphaproteobacteria bacterium]|nr:hydroxyacid dehydrogenase [Alphaproteobacteria bacterium]